MVFNIVNELIINGFQDVTGTGRNYVNHNSEHVVKFVYSPAEKNKECRIIVMQGTDITLPFTNALLVYSGLAPANEQTFYVLFSDLLKIIKRPV